MTSNHLLLYRIAELMLVSGRHVLAVDELFDDEKIGDFVKSIQIDSPYQQMLYEGVLTETVKDEQLKVTFTVEGYFHFILGEVIYDLSEGKDANFLISLLNSSTLNGIKEGIEQCLIRDIIHQHLERLISFNDSGGDYREICIRPLLYFMKSYGVDTALDKLLENPSDNDWQALIELNDFLNELELQILRKEFLINVINRISFANKYDYELGLKAIESIDNKQARIYFAQIDLSVDFLQSDSRILNSFGDCYLRFGEYDKALEYFEKCLAIQLKTLGSQHPSAANSYSNIGIVWKNKGKHDKALECYEKCLAIQLKTLYNDHPSVAKTYNSIGIVWNIKGEYDKALEYHQKSLDIKLKTLGNVHPYVGNSYNNIGIVWMNKGKHDKASEYYEKSLAIMLKTLGNEDPFVANSYDGIGIVWLIKGAIHKALEYFDKCLAIRLKSLGNEHPLVAETYSNIGFVWHDKGEYDKALEFLEKCLAIRLKTLGNEHSFVAISYNNIGELWKNKGEYNIALEYYEKSLEIKLNTLNNEHPSVAETYYNIGIVLREKVEYERSLDFHQMCLDIRMKKFGIEDSRTRKSIANVKEMYQKLGKENEIPDWMKNI